MLNYFLFSVFPYVALTSFLVVSLTRYFSNSYKFSSLSSNFLESSDLFWGSQAWHWGILVILLAHFLGFMFPREVIAFNGLPVRTLILEAGLLIFGFLSLVGIILLIRRRMLHDRIRVVTSTSDVLVLLLLLLQVATGVFTALNYRWGSMWYASGLVPYLRSIFSLKPDIGFVATLPWVVKTHVASAFLLVAILPFTRLVHFLVMPISYIWRPWQKVIWYWDRKKRNYS